MSRSGLGLLHPSPALALTLLGLQGLLGARMLLLQLLSQQQQVVVMVRLPQHRAVQW
jgi:hypothetical protein